MKTIGIFYKISDQYSSELSWSYKAKRRKRHIVAATGDAEKCDSSIYSVVLCMGSWNRKRTLAGKLEKFT